MQPARPYRDRNLVGTRMTQLAPTLPPSQWPEAPKKIVLVGRNTEEAWAVASNVLALRASLEQNHPSIACSRLRDGAGRTSPSQERICQ